MTSKLMDCEDTWSAKDLHRPRLFKDFIGQETAIAILKGQVDAGKFSKSYLLTGQKGDGKTSLAKVIAKKINDTKEDKHPNIYMFNAIVDSGVDDIRKLLEQIRYAPLKAGKRVIIVDEAHGLSKAAGGALLVDLENPPDHVVWILCTNEDSKLLPTVKDRCKKIALKPLSASNVAEVLKRAATKEKVFQPLEDHAALFKSLGQMFAGRTRDALNTLSNLADISRNRSITKEDLNDAVNKAVGLEYQDIPKFLALMYSGKTKDAFEILQKVTDYNGFSHVLLDLNTYLLKKATGLEPPFNYGAKIFGKFAPKLSVPQLHKMQRVLMDLRREITATSAVTPEAVLVYYCVEMAA